MHQNYLLVAFMMPLVSVNVSLGDEKVQSPAVATCDFDMKVGMRVIARVGDAPKSLYMCFDTGASHHVFDARHSDLLKAIAGETNLRTPTNTLKLPLYESATIFLDQFATLSKMPVLIMKLDTASEAAGWQLDGAFSPSQIIASNILEIDFDSERITIHSKESSSIYREFESVPLEVDKVGIPITYPHFVQFVQPFLVDTGASGVSMNADFFDQLVNASQITETGTVLASTADSTITRRRGILRSITLGKYELKNVVVIRSTSNYIGLDVLRRFTIAFDLPAGNLYLCPNKRYDQPVSNNTSGLALGWIHGKVIVVKVDSTSPGDQAGICHGDEMLQVNELPCDGESLGEARELLRGARGRTVRIKVRRNDEVKQYEFALQDFVD